jgi:beta-N-acetylhexosaminidase
MLIPENNSAPEERGSPNEIGRQNTKPSPPDNLPIQQEAKFLKRDEVKTMAMDIARLREIEAKKEKERIASLKVETTLHRPPAPQPIPPAPFRQSPSPIPPAQSIPPAFAEASIFDKSSADNSAGKPALPVGPVAQNASGIRPHLSSAFLRQSPAIPIPTPSVILPAPTAPLPPPLPPSAPPAPPSPRESPVTQDEGRPAVKKSRPVFTSSYKKFLVRGVLVLLPLSLLGFGFWLWQGKNTPAPNTNQPIQTETPTSTPGISLPPSLILTKDTELVDISSNEEIPAILERLTKTDIPVGSFFRVAIKNSKENRWASLSDLASAFNIDAPSEIFGKLDPNFTLAIFSQKEGRRIALIAKTTDSLGLINLLKSWDKSIAKEAVAVGGKNFTPLTSFFRIAKDQGTYFKYLTFSKNDLGVVYLVLDDYFVLTSSFESMKKVIDELIFEKKLGQLFLVGFEGKTLTPELTQFLKKYRPGGLLLLSKNIDNKEQLKKLISDVQTASLKETGLPLFIAVDQEGGPVSRVNFLEELTPQSKIDSQETALRVGLKRGQELKNLGINLNLAPLLDKTAPTDFLFGRSFQKDSLEIGGLAKSLISGQKTAGILTAIKHFPGYTDISENPEEKLAEKENVPEISQFQIATESDPEMIITSNVVYETIDPGLPFTFSAKAIQFLKEKLNKNILIVSDDLSQNSLLGKFSLKDIVSKPIEAGVDIMIFSGYKAPVEQGLNEFLNAFKEGVISKEKVENALSRIIKLKQGL